MAFSFPEHNYPQARYHYLHSMDGKGCAAMLLEYHVQQGYPSEVDLFITQAVLQLVHVPPICLIMKILSQ